MYFAVIALAEKRLKNEEEVNRPFRDLRMKKGYLGDSWKYNQQDALALSSILFLVILLMSIFCEKLNNDVEPL